MRRLEFPLAIPLPVVGWNALPGVLNALKSSP